MLFDSSNPHVKPKNEIELRFALHIRKLKLISLCIVIGFSPFLSVLSFLIPFYSVKLFLILLYVCFSLLFVLYHLNIECPRCKKLFYWEGKASNMFTTKCLNCGLSTRKKNLVIEKD